MYNTIKIKFILYRYVSLVVSLYLSFLNLELLLGHKYIFNLTIPQISAKIRVGIASKLI